MADNLYKETFSHVRSSYEFNIEDFEKKAEPEKKKPRRHFPVRKLIVAAAAAVALTALGISASATGFFGLAEPTEPTEPVTPETPTSPDVLFVEGYAQSPEGLAWDEVARGSETLENIAAKYGLTVSDRGEVYTYPQLTELTGGDFLSGGHVPAAAGIYEDGSFRLEGVYVSSDGRQVTYELLRSVKGTLNFAELSAAKDRSLRPLEAGERTLALVEGDGETVLAADLGESWAAVVLRGTGLDRELLSELGGDVAWERLAGLEKPQFPEKAQPVVFGAGVELLEENIIADQSFGAILAGLGRVRFISYAPTEEFGDVRFFFSADGTVSTSELTPVLTGLTFVKVAAVSFEDLTGDGFADILLLIDYRDGNGDLSRHVRIFVAEGNGNFNLETRISRKIEAAVANSRLDVYAVRAWLRRAWLHSTGASEEPEGAQGYARVLADNLSKYGDDYFTRYTVFDLTGDGEPELIAGEGACEADAVWSVWTMEDGEPRLLGTIGAGHSVLYERDGELLRLYGQMGWEIIDRIFWNGEELVEENLSERLLEPFEEYARPGQELLTAAADDVSLIEPMSFEELIRRAGKLYAGTEALAGYALYDLNGDGSSELILRVESAAGTVYRFYALAQGRAVPLGSVKAQYDNLLAADGTTLYLLERDLTAGSESIYTIAFTDTLTQSVLSSRRGLSPADLTDPARLGTLLEMRLVPEG